MTSSSGETSATGVTGFGTHGLSSLELHSGVLLGSVPIGPVQATATSGSTMSDPRAVLEAIVARHLRAGPCVVRFSGGRDSSLVLAVAAHVARREGFPLPTALAVRYPGHPDADESAWQDLVIDRLEVPFDIIEVADGDDDIAGPLGVRQLLSLGPFLPPTSGVTLGRIGPAVAGRTVLSGQGGDEVLGESRVTPWVAHWRRRRKPSRDMTMTMLADLAPAIVRRAQIRHRLRLDDPLFWLRPVARRAVVEPLVNDLAELPWSWRAARWQTLRTRLWTVGSTHLARVAAHEGFRLVDPLLDPSFVHAINRAGGRFGFVSRTEAMKVLAADLLPLRVLRRQTKASFENVYAGRRTREFARSWDGTGVDQKLVDVDLLRSAWMSDRIPVGSLAPLQLALLEAARGGWRPAEEGVPQ